MPTATDPAGLRARRRLRTADDIERVALELFAGRGYDSVTVDEIAEAAGISVRTFFRYFPTKDGVLLRDQDRRLTQLRDALAARPADEPPLVAVRQAFLAMAASYEEDRDRAVRWAAVVAATPGILPRFAAYGAQFMAPVRALVAERLGLDPVHDLRPGVIATAMTGATHVAYEQWLAAPTRPLPELAAEALDLVEAGLRSVVDGAGTLRR